MTTSPQVTDTLREQDQTIDTAISQRDSATLNALLADDFIYTHSNGRSQSKSEFIDGVVGRQDPPRRELSGIGVEQHADIAITRGDLDIHYFDDRPSLYMRYVRLYRLGGDTWRAISQRTVYAIDRNPDTRPSAH